MRNYNELIDMLFIKDNQQQRNFVEYLLVKLGKHSATHLVEYLLSNPDLFFKKEWMSSDADSIGLILIKIGEPAVEPLIPLLVNEKEEISFFGYWVLGGIKDQRSIEPLLDYLYHKGIRFYYREGSSLDKFDNIAIEAIIARVKNDYYKNEKNLPLTVQLLFGIIRMKSSFVYIDELSKLLDDSNQEIQITVNKIINNIVSINK